MARGFVCVLSDGLERLVPASVREGQPGFDDWPVRHVQVVVEGDPDHLHSPYVLEGVSRPPPGQSSMPGGSDTLHWPWAVQRHEWAVGGWLSWETFKMVCPIL